MHIKYGCLRGIKSNKYNSWYIKGLRQVDPVLLFHFPVAPMRESSRRGVVIFHPQISGTTPLKEAVSKSQKSMGAIVY